MSFLSQTGLAEVWSQAILKFSQIGHSHTANDLKVESLSGGTSIPSNANLNTYNTVGNYYCSSNVTAATLSGTPSDLDGKMFLLKVGLSSGTNYNYQELIRYNDGKRWYRYNTSGTTGTTWSSWVAYSPITVDSALSSSSTNPVQNSTIYAAIGDVESILEALL